MERKGIFRWMIFVLLALALTACSLEIPMTGPTVNDAATQQAFIFTSVAGTATVMAQQTQAVLPPVVEASATPQPPVVVTATPEPTSTPVTPTSTPVTPTATLVIPTATPVIPTATIPSPTPTSTPIPCNMASFVGDVTIPDGTVLSAGQNFTKTWRLKNVGSCTWTTSYALVQVGGDVMGAPSVSNLPGNVAPGQVIDLSVTMTAPGASGHYRNDWRLRDDRGVLFGVGNSGFSFFTDIRVGSISSKYPLDFVAGMCQAEWNSGAGRLTCPGKDNDAGGFVLRVDNPTLENGGVDNEPVLVTYPQMITDGVIRGKYPSFRVESGQHFMAIIGCAYNATSCDVNFQLDYQIGDGSIQTLQAWHEVYDKQYRGVNVDLSSLVGKDVKFILTVFANGASTQDRAQWLAPRIVKP